MCEARTIALGTFDGLHRGHMQVLESAKQGVGIPSAVLFTEHPQLAIHGEAPPALLTAKKREELLRKAQIAPLYLAFRDVMQLSAEQFFEEILLRKFLASALCCGENYTFGKSGAGNTQLLERLCSRAGIPLQVSKTVCFDGSPISSTRIRRALQNGEIEAANAMLGRPFSYAFEVVSGDRRGRLLHFPTINQFFPTDFICPRYGVYASRVFVDGAYHPAVTNFGVRPTIGTQTPRSETCILDYAGDLYGTYPQVELLAYLRPEQKFDSLALLQTAIAADSCRAREYFQNTLANDREKL